MSDAKDSAIKLFGRTIKLPEIPSKKAESESGLNYSARSTDALLDDGVLRHRSCSPSSLAEGIDLGRDVAKRDSAKGVSDGDGVEVDISTELFDQTGMKGNRKAPSIEDQNESNEPHDKTLKKPDNLLPCPRCNSLDTKFCYYNNYNVSQPRHFCKNCHRYWTAGGTIRNVAVGTGRRKNKNVANTIHPTLKPNHNGLLSNGSMGESIGSVLNIADKSVHDLNSNGFSPVGFSVPLFPAVAPYVVGCSMPGTWTVPWLNSLPASQKYENPNTCLNSQTFGKRSRDDDSLMKHVNPEKYEPLNNPSVLSRSLSFRESSPDKSRRS